MEELGKRDDKVQSDLMISSSLRKRSSISSVEELSMQ
jgi:hypothetical protein